MNMEIEKEKIINAIELETDEWVIKAIKKLLDIDYTSDISKEHEFILNERIAEYNSGDIETSDWEDVKRDLSKELDV
jgi:hypothetical protein